MEQVGKRIGQGYTAEVYEYGADKILKLYRKGMPDAACQREFKATKNIGRSFAVAPKAFEMLRIDGRIGAVYEKIAGATMLNVMLRRMYRLRAYSRKLAQIHFSIQKEVPFELPTVKEKLKQDLDGVKSLSEPEKEKIIAYLDRLPDGDRLCYFDFHPGNILLRGSKPVVIDWMTACKGDPHSDVARTGIILKYADFPSKSGLVKKIAHSLMGRIYQSYYREYLRISRASDEDVSKWELPVAAARLREWIPQEESQRLLDMIHSLIA